MRGRGFRRVVAVIAVTVAVLAVAAPASAKDNVERRIRRAVNATQREETARVALRVGIVAESGEGEITGDGAVSLTGEQGQLVLDVSDVAGTPASFEERIVDGVVYVDFGSVLEAAGETLPGTLAGKRWIRVDLSNLTGIDAEQLQILDPSGGATPTSQVDALRGIDDAVRVGTEEIAGIRTAHFRGALRLALARKALDALPDELRQAAEAGLEQLFRGDRKLAVDLWLDDENRLRQMRTRIEIEDTEHVLVTVTLTIPEFGVPVDVVAPPAEETVDVREFLDAAAAS